MITFVHELISHSVQRSPEAIALQVKNMSLSYAQLNEKVTKVAQAYASLAITRGDRIGIYISKIIDKKVSRFTNYLVCDGGLHHHLANSCNFGQLIRKNYPVAIRNKLKEGVQELVNIVGPICNPLDILADKIMLPKASMGDYVVVFQSGTYVATASPKDLLSQPQVSELLI
ncbi:AMP-binding protein [Colwellia psychrerythraea]|uniref:Decarboxylase domain protein n=1 Tax=Colwellia psychrerythraea (strain 34H / ATCC BAA-681) TaxID=167879 RepID=Q47VX8_COLP3|nr:AMP-binding protein [Colwellia psychrerythraea]AAZ24303.1 decarboxylase domain protein [Colwellia psychrerythraea 34H]